MPTGATPADGQAQRMDALELRDEVQLLRLQLLRSGSQDEPAACASAGLSAALSSLPDPAGDSVVSVTVRLEAAVALREHGQSAASARALASARSIAARMRHDYLRVLAEGRLAQAALADGDARASIRLARQAASGAQHWPALRYQWEWTAGRAHLRSGDRPTALRWYRLAADTLDSLSQTGAAPRAYSLSGRLHFELADLLLADLGPADATRAASDSETGRLLLEARARIERSKVAELRDYFDDECVAELQSRIAPVDRLPEGTAVLYPILFEDRVELLLSLPEAIIRHVVPVGRDTIEDEARRFRALLARRTTRQVLRPAGQLYDWLVRPLERALDGGRVETLVIVPEGPLRLIPMAALHDGKRFLVERFALGQTPGLTLTDARQLERQDIRALVAGLTQARSGFPALPNVADEVRRVAGRTGATVLLDEGFSSEVLTGSLREQPFTVVHLASHAQFDADPDATFLLTWDGRVGLRDLADAVGAARFRRDPLELLTLSACETAVGDERSALGFAGAAVGSGARSVLASLWAIDDRASADLLSRFYAHLLDDGETKASALRRAQRAMLDDRRYAHPAYWASFVLIGNWR